MRRTLVLLFAGLLISIVGCNSEKSSNQKELRLFSLENISGFDPINASDMYSSVEIGRVYEGLYEFHPFKRPYELVPNLADGMPAISKDGLTYTFKIKKDVLFQDSEAFSQGKGRLLRADDFVYSIKRLADPKNQAKGWWLFDDKIVGLNEWRKKNRSSEKGIYEEEVEGLRAIDGHTLVIKLKKIYPQLMSALAMPYSFVVAREAVEHYGKEFLNYPVGTGPFLLPRFEHSKTIVYRRNPNFREKLYPSEGEAGDKEAGLLADAGKRLPLVDKITLQITVESLPRWLHFQKGDFDLLELKDNNHQQAKSDDKLRSEFVDKGMRMLVNPRLDITYYAFNHDDPFFKNNRKLRQAMSLALDRKTLNRLFYDNTATLAQGVVPPGLAGHEKDYENPYVKHDIERAKSLLAEAGYPKGKGVPEIKLQTLGDTISRQIGELFMKNMDSIGIKVALSTNTWPELVQKVSKRQHQLYVMSWGADYPDAENFLGLLYCPNSAPGSNGSNFCDQEYDKLFRKASVLQDTPERTALYVKMNHFLSEEVPWIFGVHRSKVNLIQGWVRNYKYLEFDHAQSQYLDVDIEERQRLLKKF